jgi:hypothetical protein
VKSSILQAQLPLHHTLLSRYHRLGFLLPSVLCSRSMSNASEFTITVSEDTNNHGDENLLCFLTKWSDIAVFFLANYVAHATMVKSIPGELTITAFVTALIALLFPVSGVERGMRAILEHAIIYYDLLEAALKAGILGVVVRTDEWSSQADDEIHGATYTIYGGVELELSSEGRAKVNRQEGDDVIEMHDHTKLPAANFDKSYGYDTFMPAFSWWENGSKVHGICHLPAGYKLISTPPIDSREGP